MLFCINAELDISPEAKRILGHQRTGKEKSTRRLEKRYMRKGFIIRFLHEKQGKKEDVG
jgi:hypothetical protein